MNADNPTDLAAIVAHDRVRALRPEWYKPTCTGCGWVLDHVMLCASANCAADESREHGERLFHGPDLLAADQLHQAVALLCEFANPSHNPSVEINKCTAGWCVGLNGRHAALNHATCNEAVCAAIARALNIEGIS